MENKRSAKDLVGTAFEQARLGNEADAHRMFLRATELDPANDRAWIGCARTTPDLSMSLEFLQQAVQANPRNSDARVLLSDLGMPAPALAGPWISRWTLLALVLTFSTFVLLLFLLSRLLIH